MGRGFLSWALRNKSAFVAVTHPDVDRHADAELRAAIEVFQNNVRDATVAAQQAGRHPESGLLALTLFTNSVPFGAAMLMHNPMFKMTIAERDIDEMVAKIVDLVVPLEPAQLS